MVINGFQKLSLLDFPKKTACIIFTAGCNYKCLFCQNSSLIDYSKNSLFSEQEIFDYLDSRKKVIDGIVISGGEPTMQRDLVKFITKVKEKGFLVKLDTNGSNYDVLAKLIDENLVDYVAMDIKDTYEDYENLTKVKVKIDNLKKSIELLKKGKVDYEFRTTIIKNYHSMDKILQIISYVGQESKYYLQNFEDSENVLDKSLKSFSKEELRFISDNVKKFPNVKVRGI